jgi:phospholipid N-methyltransferase
VLELGAGTGTVTEALLANGVAPDDLYLVERDRQLVKILQRRFPRCHVVATDALELDLPCDAEGSFDFVVSGLPLLCFSPDKRYRALQRALQMLKPRGQLHQFTYAGRCPVDKDLRALLRVDSALLGIVPLNLPPAFVYRLTPR